MSHEQKVVTNPKEAWPYTKVFLDGLIKPSLSTIGTIELVVFPQVFPPTTETMLLLSHLPSNLSGKNILDVTTGTGVIAVHAGLRGAHGTAVDINPQAVINARLNSLKQHVANKVLLGNLFTNIPDEEKFDYIFVTPPYYEGEPKNDLEHAVFGGRQFVENFFEGLQNQLMPGGKILMTYAEWAGKEALNFLEETATAHGYNHNILGKKASKTGKLTYRLYEFCKEKRSARA